VESMRCTVLVNVSSIWVLKNQT